MTSSNGNIFRVTGPLWGESTGDRWIPLTKASDAELWWFFFICALTNGWMNNRGGCDHRRHRAHYDVTVMKFLMQATPSVVHYTAPQIATLEPTKILFMYFRLLQNILTHWRRDYMATIFQTIFSSSFSWIESVVFWFKFVADWPIVNKT